MLPFIIAAGTSVVGLVVGHYITKSAKTKRVKPTSHPYR